MELEAIKICGLSTPQALEAVIVGGATHMGLIFFEKSPRHVDLETAEALSKIAKGRVKRVAVSVNASAEYLDEIVTRVQPDMLQLHGSESPESMAELKAKYGLPLIKALAIHEVNDLEKIAPYSDVADLFLFDAKPPKGSDLPGGNGVAFDWQIMDQLPENVPYMLSGGLNIDNIGVALEQSGAGAIDISSGVESSPGQKDIGMIEAFLNLTTNTGSKEKARA